MKNNTWALEKLIFSINEKDKIIKNMCTEICKLRGVNPNNEIMNSIIFEFKNKEEQ